MRTSIHRAIVFVVAATFLSALSLALTAQSGAQKSALVTVVSDSGARTIDLTAKDFIVREDGTVREVVGAVLATEPLFITLLVDTTQPPMGGLPSATQDLRTALSKFVKTIHGVSPDAHIAVMQFAGAAVRTLDFTQNSDELDTTVQRLFPNQQSGAVLLEALSEASRKLAEKPTPRRAIVTVDFNSPENGADQTMKKVADEVRKSGATVWAVSVRGTDASASTREAVLNAVTQSSGGLRLTSVDSSGLDGMLSKVANTLLSQYTVTFARPGSSPMKTVKMETARGARVFMSPWMR